MDIDLPVCVACGTQFGSMASQQPSSCKICDDPRQYIPSSGQAWTTLKAIRQEYQVHAQQDPVNSCVWSLWMDPKFAIGQRAFFIHTPHGNVLWDMIPLPDSAVQEFIQSKGGLDAIIISHPHFYTTYVEWARAFSCPVYLSADDQEWICRQAPVKQSPIWIEGPPGTSQNIIPGVTAIIAGGHFPGSLVLHWDEQLFIADTIMTVPSAHTPHPRPPGQISYTFQWSIPNMIPLPPSDIFTIWRAIKPFNFHTTFGAFSGMTVRDPMVKERILQSMKVQVRREGYRNHEIFSETSS